MLDPKVKTAQAKLCPICGALPVIEKESLAGQNGHHGYPGEFSYNIFCPVCGYPKEQSAVTLGCTDEEARQKSIVKWNEQADRIEEFLTHRK